MSFLRPKIPAPPPVPPPPPLPPAPALEAKGTEEAELKERLKRKKGVSSTILTGPKGLLPEQMPVTSTHLLSGESKGPQT